MQRLPTGRYKRDRKTPGGGFMMVDGLVAAQVLPGDDKRYVTGTYCTIGPVYPRGRLVLHLIEVDA